MSKPRDTKYGLTLARVNEVLLYDPVTGIFRWKIKVSDRAPVGKEAGGFAVRGYRRIKIDGVYYFSHRLAWLLMTGKWPPVEIDHKNRVRHDNRWVNLRLATHSQNHANCGLRADNTVGYKGVARSRGKFIGVAVKDGKRHCTTVFASPEEAYAAYLKKSRELHGEYHSGAV